MRSKAWKTVAIWSVASFTVSMAFLLPGSLQADGPRASEVASVPPPSITTDHFQLSLKLANSDQATYPHTMMLNPGQAPKLKLEATNKTNVALPIPLKIQM